jgi:pimeloyl-ACP methyl ester carboxylesterase
MASRRAILRTVALVALGGLAVLATAPLWAPHTWLTLPAPLPPGTAVRIRGGHHVNVFDEGQGTPIVLVHGLPGSAHDWRPLPEQLVEAGFRVIRYDRIGYGHSSRRGPDDPHSVESNASDLLALIDALELTKPVLVGWSYGGAVAQIAASRAGTDIAAVLLVGSDGPAGQSPGWFRTLFAATLPLRQWGIRSGFPARIGVLRMARQSFGNSVPPWWTDHALSVISPEGVARTWTREVSEFDSGLLRPEGISVPVTILHGSEDTNVAPQVAEALHRSIPGSTLRWVTGAGHMLPNTHAGEVVEELRKLVAAL